MNDSELLVLVKIVEDLSTVVAAMDRPQMNISKRKRGRMRVKIDLGLLDLRERLEARLAGGG